MVAGPAVPSVPAPPRGLFLPESSLPVAAAGPRLPLRGAAEPGCPPAASVIAAASARQGTVFSTSPHFLCVCVCAHVRTRARAGDTAPNG